MKEKKKSKLKSILDYYADLLFIKTISNETFFSENDVEHFTKEFFGNDFEDRKNKIAYEREFEFKAYTPELILKNFLNKE